MNSEDFAIRFFREVTVRNDKALPCPFCGSREIEADLQMDDVSWVVICECGSYGPYTQGGGPTLALDAWSRRTSTPNDWLSSERRGLRSTWSVSGERLEGLAPCPFCGYEEFIYEPGPSLNAVSCLVCSSSAAVGNGSREKAILAWNQRSLKI
jgi:transcription elongation factor Elf1